MKRSNKAVPFLALGLLLASFVPFALNNALKDERPKAGSLHCGKCHGKQYRQWQNNPSRASCESCHGGGRSHVVAPTRANILLDKKPDFIHGPSEAAAPAPQDSLRLELFIMSYCPYGVAALQELLPLARKWGGRLHLKIYYIAHQRGMPRETPSGERLPLEGNEKCESSDGSEEGTERFISLHGLPEVLEDMRQTVIAHAYPEYLADYLSFRCRDLAADWREQARAAGLPETAVRKIRDLSDSQFGDSLFEANITEAEKRGVTGSPTLFINGLEFGGAVGAYPVERHFCQEARPDTLCRGFPECGFDNDCIQEGKSGTCLHPMEKGAKCVFREAATFDVTVVNDENCPLCHTGNIIRETRRRFPGARFIFMDIHSAGGKAAIRQYGLKAYPSFLFGTAVEKSEKFAAIRRTFRKVKDRYILMDRVVKSYHFLDRPEIPRRLDLFGAAGHPPVIEMLRDFEPLTEDTSLSFRFAVHPFAEKSNDRESRRQLCVDSLHPGRTAYAFRLCRGFDVQRRFEEHLPEPDGEWRSCAAQLKLNSAAVEACVNGGPGKALLEKSLALGRAVGVDGPDPVILLNNRFRIAGYNPAIRKILMQEFGK